MSETVSFYFWGEVNGVGENTLGTLLMAVRASLPTSAEIPDV